MYAVKSNDYGVAIDAQHRAEIFGGADRDRTGDPLLAKQVLSQLSYSPAAASPRVRAAKRSPATHPVKLMVGLDRLELSTSPLSGVRSSHLSYRPYRAIS